MGDIRFAHLADLHLGAYREKKLLDLNFKTFQKAIEKVILEKVDFCLFAGDIFNNAMPPIELVEKVAKELIKLKESNIPLYIIGGSHDYSNTGKSFLTLLETTQIFKDVCKFEYLDHNKVKLNFTKDEKTNTILSGILGKKNGLDKNIYTNINQTNLSKENFNIFLFHCTLDDFKPDFMKAVKTEVKSSYLPKGFDYYAGGHVHTHIEGKYDSGILSFPGPLFPNNFSELKRETPSFNLCEFDFKTRETKIKRIFIKTYEKEYLKIEINGLNPVEAKSHIESKLEKLDYKDKILLIEISGIVEGKITDININKIIANCYENGVFVVLKNTYKLTSSDLKFDLELVKDNVLDIENEIISEILKDSKDSSYETKLIKALLGLELGKIEGEKVAQYEERVTDAISKSLNTL